MNENSAVTLINLGVLALTGLMFYWTHNWWSLIILVCMFKTETRSK
jgi:hypothetical protein